MDRKATPVEIETAVLLKCARRCTLCFHLTGDLGEKIGQIAHVDKDPSNSEEDNLAFMCLPHHSLFDSRTSQHKNYTPQEVKAARAKLHEAISQSQHSAATARATVPDWELEATSEPRKPLVFVPHQFDWPHWSTHIVKPAYRMALTCRWVVTNVSSQPVSVTNTRLEDPRAPGAVSLFTVKKGLLPDRPVTIPSLHLSPNEIGEVECTFFIQPPLHHPPHPVDATVVLGDNLGNEYRFPRTHFAHQFPVSESYMNAYFPRQQPTDPLPTPPANRPRIAFREWGEISTEHPAPIRSGQTAFYLVNDGGAAYEVTVEGFEIQPSVRTAGETLARIEKDGKGFALVWLQNYSGLAIASKKWDLPGALAKADRESRGDWGLHGGPDYTVVVSVIYRDADSLWWFRSSARLTFIRSQGRISLGATSHERWGPSRESVIESSA